MIKKSMLAIKYCIGKGLEIGGSAHNPFGLNTLNVDIYGSTKTIFKKEEIKQCGRALPVNIIAPGDNIPLPDASEDFIISSHVLEHMPDPIKALIEWDRLIKPNGIIFMIIPHKERTFDKNKPRTPLKHLIEDYQNCKTSKKALGHEHIWIPEDIINLIRYMKNNLGMKWCLEKVQDPDDKAGNGFAVVLRKKIS